MIKYYDFIRNIFDRNILIIEFTIVNLYIHYNININQDTFRYEIFIAITTILSIIYLISLGILWDLEKSISKPLNAISNIMQKYSKSENKINDEHIMLSQIEKFTDKSVEIGILANSYQSLVKNLTNYMKNLKEVEKDKERIMIELKIAKDMQESMLPKIFPPFPDRIDEFDIYAMSVSAKEVGGDFYDYFLIDEDHLTFVIGDVSSKGVPAALFMAISKILIRNQSERKNKISDVFSGVNNTLCENNTENMFLTAWLGILEISTGKISFVNAGHTFPYIKNKNGDVKLINQHNNLILGIKKDMKYYTNEVQLKKGDKLFLYTDGVTEAMNDKKEFFTEQLLTNILKKDMGLEYTLKRVNKEINDFTGDEEQFDDITMLIVEYKKEPSDFLI